VLVKDVVIVNTVGPSLIKIEKSPASLVAARAKFSRQAGERQERSPSDTHGVLFNQHPFIIILLNEEALDEIQKE
jgi:hypothetical protein